VPTRRVKSDRVNNPPTALRGLFTCRLPLPVWGFTGSFHNPRRALLPLSHFGHNCFGFLPGCRREAHIFASLFFSRSR
jgi:hypothetical protein